MKETYRYEKSRVWVHVHFPIIPARKSPIFSSFATSLHLLPLQLNLSHFFILFFFLFSSISLPLFSLLFLSFSPPSPLSIFPYFAPPLSPSSPFARSSSFFLCPFFFLWLFLPLFSCFLFFFPPKTLVSL